MFGRKHRTEPGPPSEPVDLSQLTIRLDAHVDRLQAVTARLEQLAAQQASSSPPSSEDSDG